MSILPKTFAASRHRSRAPHPMSTSSPRILIVDEPGDDLALVSLVLRGALDQARLETVEDMGGLAAALAAGAPSVVITERTLPWADGFDVLEAVRKLHPDCPVVFFSNAHEPSPRDSLRGLDGWVPKDSTGFLHLPKLVQRLTRRARGTDPALRPGAGVDKLPVAVLTAAPDGAIIGANHAAAMLLGASDRAELEGRSLVSLLRPGPAQDQLCAALEGGEPLRAQELELQREDGEPTWARVSLWGGAGPGGKPRFAATLEDISPYKRSEARLERLAQDLGRSNQALERFASVVSHDLRGPLGVVKRGAKLMEDAYGEGLEPEASQLLGTILQGSERLESMIQDVLDMARVGVGQGPPQPTDFGAVLHEALSSLSPTIQETGAEVSCDRLPTLSARPGQIQRLFENLLGNALKFRRDKRPIVHVGAFMEPGQWVFSVQDNGIGLEPAQSERVFDMFERLHNGSYPGHGMGLAISKEIVERHGGRIWVQSMRGEGSTFYFSIPTGEPRPGGEP
jgi:PAS domain S-box-containing protein